MKKDRRRSLYRRDFRKLCEVISIRSRLSTKFIGCLVKPSLRPNFVIRDFRLLAKDHTERVFAYPSDLTDRSTDFKLVLRFAKRASIKFHDKSRKRSVCIMLHPVAPTSSGYIQVSEMTDRLPKLRYCFIFHVPPSWKTLIPVFIILFRERRKMFNFIDSIGIIFYNCSNYSTCFFNDFWSKRMFFQKIYFLLFFKILF